MDTRPILIAGAGIGGLTLAIALAKRGIRSVVAERAPVLEEIGAALQLGANSSRLLEALGLGPAIDAAGIRPGDVRIMDGKNDRLITTMPLGAEGEKRWGAPHRVIHRAALQRILAEAAQADDLDLRLGLEFADHSESIDGVPAVFRSAAGNQTVAARALIGADGVRSAVRTKIGGGSLKFSGRVAWRATTKHSARAEITVWFGPGAHFLTYPLDKSGTLNIVAVTQ